MNDECKRLACTLIVLAFCGALSCLCCGESASSQDVPTNEPTTIWPGASVFANSCLPCHGADGPASVDLSDLANMRRRAPTAAKLVRERLMPPWLASDTGAPLAHSRKLSDQDRTALLDWLDHNAPGEVIALGQPAMTSGRSVPAAPAAPSHDPRACDSSIRIAQDWQIGADPGMQLRTFAMTPQEEVPKHIQGIELDADAPGVVHSVSFVWDQRGYGLRLDASDPQPGYDAVGDIGLQASGAGGTVSRLKNPWRLPAGYAIEIARDAALVAEVHAESRGKVESPAVTIRFIAAVEPFRILHAHSFSSIRPATIASRCDAVSIAIRAGSRVESIQVIAQHPTGALCILLDIPVWNERFSEPWFFDPPVDLSGGTKLTVRSTINPLAQTIPLDEHAALMSETTVVILAADYVDHVDHVEPTAKIVPTTTGSAIK